MNVQAFDSEVATMIDGEDGWANSQNNLELPNDAVHIWRARLDLPSPQVERVAEIISDVERGKARCFRFEQDQRRFIVSHGMLRLILSRYLDFHPGQIRICAGSRGKPRLAKTRADGTLQFNLSHSHQLAVYAFARNGQIGIDLEYIRPVPDAEQIADRFFSPRENATLRALPLEKRQEAFFNCWTRKEAMVKALGEGLAQSLDQFDVFSIPGEPAHGWSVHGNAAEASGWFAATFTPAPGYLASLAVLGSCRDLDLFYFSSDNLSSF